MPRAATITDPYETLLSEWCTECVHDAGFQSGMAGAARCPLVERALAAACGEVRPAEWQPATGGALRCTAFVSDLAA